MLGIEVKTAGVTCAWRGLYVYGPDLLHRGSEAQLARVVLDPNNGVRPTLCIAVALPYRSSTGWRLSCGARGGLKLRMPYVPWSFVVRRNSTGKAARWRVALYQASSRFWLSMDTRFREQRRNAKP